MALEPGFCLWGGLGRGTYLQGSEEETASNGDTDLVVVVDFPFAVCGKTMNLLENQDQNGSCVQVLLNTIGSEGKER